MMPSIHRLEKRLDPGITFSFVFAAVAGSVVLACVIWGFALPKWRKRHPTSPSPTKWNDGSILTRRGKLRHFPSRPTIRPLLSKPSATQVIPMYNPRTESPFPRTSTPNTPSSPIYMDVPFRIHSAPTISREISSNGLFTPVRGSVYKLEPIEHCHTIPRASDSKYFETKSVDYGHAKEFILAMPEPLLLRPRSGDGPYSAIRRAEKYGSAQTASTGSDKLLHPKKLFQALQRLDQRSSLCSSTSLRIDHRESDAVYAETQIAGALNQALREDALRRKHMRQRSDDSDITAASAISQDSTHSRMTSLHRARSYKSLTGSQSSKVTRGDTISKANTTVVELKKLHRVQDEQQTEPVPKLPSISTATTMVSDNGTSPGSKITSAPGTPSSPLECLPATTFGISIQDKPRRSVTQPEQNIKFPLANQGQPCIRVRASSLYSRDTSGYSLDNTPITPNFPSPAFEDFQLNHSYKGRESVRDRINHWNQWVDRDNTPPMPLSPIPIAFATQEVEASDTKETQVSRSTAIDEVVSASKLIDQAPGGAVWI